MSNSLPATAVLQAVAGAAHISNCFSLGDCFGKLLAMDTEQLKDLPGKPQQVMLAQTLFYLKSTVALEESLRQKTIEFERLAKAIDIVNRRQPAAVQPLPRTEDDDIVDRMLAAPQVTLHSVEVEIND